MTLTDEELFEGLLPEQAERYGRQARQLWGQGSRPNGRSDTDAQQGAMGGGQAGWR